MTRTRMKFAATTLVVAVVLAGCGQETERSGPRPDSPDAPAATLRATVDRLFREYVYILGLITENSITKQTPSGDAATQALEENTLAIGDVVETVYGDSAERLFLAAWRPIAVSILTYTTAKVRKIPLRNVDRRFRPVAAAVGQFAKRLTPLLDPASLETKVRDLIASIRSVVDAQVASDYVKADRALRPAADRASAIAFTFARAFVDELPVLFAGDPASGGAAFRSRIAGLLVEHVYLVGYTTENALTKQSKPRAGAVAASEVSTAALARELGGLYGAEAEKAFQPIWQRLVQLLVAYAGSAKDADAAAKARAGLDQYVDDFIAVLGGINPLLRGGPAERLISAHVDNMISVIGAQATGDFITADLGLRAAAAAIEEFGAVVAGATVERLPGRFRGTPTPAAALRALPRGLG